MPPEMLIPPLPAALASADTGSHFCIFRNTYPAIGVCAAAKRGDHTAGDIDGAAGTEISAANASAVAVASGGDCSTLNIDGAGVVCGLIKIGAADAGVAICGNRTTATRPFLH